MESPSNTQWLLLRYLLEQLSPEERDRIDEALITDQEFSDSFAEARNEWLDAYVAGSLAPEWKKLVEQALIDTPDGASSLRVAAALHRRRTLISPKVQSKFPSRAVLAFFVPGRAACMVLAFWLRSGPTSRPTRQGLPAAGSPPVAAVKHLPPPTPVAPPDLNKAPTLGAARHGTLALVMPAGTLRGSDSVPLQLTAAIERVQLQWPLPPDQTVPEYTLQASRDGAPATKFPQHGPVRTIGTERIATFVLPAAVLLDGEYTFALYGNQTADGSPVAQFSVAVSRGSPVHGHGVDE
jgi:hypothetical protein